MIHHFLVDLRYTQIHVDNNVFRNDILFIAVYVNNILICRSDKNKILNFKIKLNNYFKMTDCRAYKYYLEMLIT